MTKKKKKKEKAQRTHDVVSFSHKRWTLCTRPIGRVNLFFFVAEYW